MDKELTKIEQTESAPIETDIKSSVEIDKETADSYGKFKSKEALLNAYNSLEAEFTKRSQELKEIKKLGKERNWEDEIGKLLSDYPIAKDMSGEIEAEIKNRPELLAKENTLELALLSCLSKTPNRSEPLSDTELIKAVTDNEAVKNKIIESYFEKVSLTPRTISGGGKIVMTAPKRATTIAEAGAMAEQYLKGK